MIMLVCKKKLCLREVARLRGCEVARLRGCEVARLRGCELCRERFGVSSPFRIFSFQQESSYIVIIESIDFALILVYTELPKQASSCCGADAIIRVV